MTPLHENSIADVVRILSKASRFSPKQVKQAVDDLPADQLINLVASVEKQNIKQALQLLQFTNMGSKKTTLEDVQDKLHSLEKDSKLGQRTRIRQILSIVGSLSDQDWELTWPTLDPKTMQGLYHHVSNQKTENVTKSQAQTILHHAKEEFMEQVIYKDQIVEVRVPRGPNNTVGIILDHKLTMVPRADCGPINEQVMGMTQMPSLARMLTLAGVDTLPEASDGIREDKLPLGMRVVVEFDPEQPMDKTRVKILNVDATVTLEGLRLRIQRQFRDLSADLTSGSPDYKFAGANAKSLANSLDTMQAALQDLQIIRTSQGAGSNIPEVLENEDY
jgi:hypothetical protein